MSPRPHRLFRRAWVSLAGALGARPLVSIAAGLAAGCWWGQGLPREGLPSPGWLAAAGWGLGLLWLGSRRRLPVALPLLVALAGGLAWAPRAEPAPLPVSGRVRGRVVSWALLPDGARADLVLTTPRPVRARVRLPPHTPPLAPGDQVLLLGDFAPHHPLANPGKPARPRPWLVGRARGVVRLSTGASGPWRGFPTAAGRVRASIQRATHRTPAVAGVLQALALGQASAIPPATRDRFAEAGLSHLLAISGLHLGIAAVLLFGGARRMLLWLPGLRLRADRLAALVAMAGVAGVVAWVGHPPSAVRAGLMTWVLLAASMSGRRPDGWTALAAAVLAAVATDPSLLRAPGFQLSVAAVAGLLGFRWPPPGRPQWVRRALVGLGRATFAATVATAPLVALHFGRLPFAASLSNLVAVPLASVLVPLVAVATLAVASVGPPADGLWHPAAALVSALVRVADEAARLPFASLPVLPPSPGRLLITLLGVVGAARAPTWPRRLVWTALVLGALRLGPIGVDAPPLSVTFLSVGHGDAILIRTPAGDVLVDAGGDPQGKWDVGARVVVPALRALGVRRLAAVVATHPHPDHVGGLGAVLAAFPVGALFTTGDGHTGPLAPALAVARRHHVPLRTACRDPLPDLGPVALDCLQPTGPDPEGTYDPLATANDNSVVLGVRLGQVRFLLPGDIEAEGETRLLAGRAPLAATVVKAPHHGSRTSSTAGFVAATGATHAVFSVGDPRGFGHPHPEVATRWRDAGARTWDTHRHGAVEFVTDGQALEVRSMRPRTEGDRTGGGGGSRGPPGARTQTPPPRGVRDVPAGRG